MILGGKNAGLALFVNIEEMSISDSYVVKENDLRGMAGRSDGMRYRRNRQGIRYAMTGRQRLMYRLCLLGVLIAVMAFTAVYGYFELRGRIPDEITLFQDRVENIDFGIPFTQVRVSQTDAEAARVSIDHAKKADIPVRFAACKLAEGDELILEQLKLDENEKQLLEHIVKQMEQERGLDRSAAIADMRFTFIEKICDATVVKPKESKEHLRSAKMDKILTGKYTAIPCFVAIMAAVFWLTFNVIGAALSNLLDMGISALTNLVDGALTSWNVNSVIHSLVIDGIFNGVGSVLSFLPVIVTLFFFLSILEDSGYMARVAFVMDKLLRKIGLSGRSIVPMLVGFGCTVPGVMASRTLPSERDRKMTILLTPFMSCSAKLPIYAFFTAAFFPKQGAVVMVALYFGGILMGILMALLLRGTMFKGEAVPFVMELPNYRMPGAKNVGQLLWEKAKDFLQRAFTVIFFATIIIWFLQTFNLHMNVVADSKDSILAVVAGIIAPVFLPLGFGNWKISTALITGFMAKESVVSTLSVLFGSTAELTGAITPVAAASLLVFCLLYTPCVAAIASIKRELGAKWAAYVVLGQCMVAWIAAFIVHLIGTLVM